MSLEGQLARRNLPVPGAVVAPRKLSLGIMGQIAFSHILLVTQKLRKLRWPFAKSLASNIYTMPGQVAFCAQ